MPIHRVCLAGAVLLASSLSLLGQAAPAEQLKVNVTAGDHDVHRPNDKEGTAIEVQISNELDLPQPDAVVVFTAQPGPVGKKGKEGPAAVFEDGQSTVTVKSDERGVARVQNVGGNGVKGPVAILVTATFENKTGTATVNHDNQDLSWWTRKHSAMVGGAVAVAGVVLWEIYKPGPDHGAVGVPVGTSSSQLLPARRNLGGADCELCK